MAALGDRRVIRPRFVTGARLRSAIAALFFVLVIPASVGLGVGLVGEYSTVVLVACGLIVAGVVIVRYPKLLIGMTVGAMFFDATLAQVLSLPTLSYSHDALTATACVVLPLRRLVSGQRLRGTLGIRWFALYAVIGAASTVIQQVPFTIGVQGGFLALKGIGFGFGVAQIDWSQRDMHWVTRVAAAALALVLVCGAINLVAPTIWTQRISGTGTVDVRFGLPSLIGPFTEPGAFGHITALGAVAALAYIQVIRRSRFALALLLGCAIAGILTFRRKAVAGLIVAGSAITFIRNRVAMVFVVCALLPIGIAVSWLSLQDAISTTFAQYFAGYQNAREALYAGSLTVAAQMFPFGAGFGQYGTHIAIVYYSPIYWQLGFDRLYGLSPQYGSFATDVFWPGILGETGVFGVVAFFAGLVAMAIGMWRLLKSGDKWLVFLGLVGIGWSVEFLLESVASAAYVSPPGYGLLFGLVGIIAGYRSSQTPPISAGNAVAARHAVRERARLSPEAVRPGVPQSESVIRVDEQ